MLNKPLVKFPKKFIQVLKNQERFDSRLPGSCEYTSDAKYERVSSLVSSYATGNLLLTLVVTLLIRHSVRGHYLLAQLLHAHLCASNSAKREKSRVSSGRGKFFLHILQQSTSFFFYRSA